MSGSHGLAELAQEYSYATAQAWQSWLSTSTCDDIPLPLFCIWLPTLAHVTTSDAIPPPQPNKVPRSWARMGSSRRLFHFLETKKITRPLRERLRFGNDTFVLLYATCDKKGKLHLINDFLGFLFLIISLFWIPWGPQQPVFWSDFLISFSWRFNDINAHRDTYFTFF